MSDEFTALEAELLKLRAAAPDETLLARLEACAAGTWSELSPEETALERSLRSVSPAPLPASLRQSLEGIFRDLEFPSEEAVIPFPARPHAKPRGNRGWWAAAAAVALTGAITALMVPGLSNRENDKIAGQPPAPPANHPQNPAIESSQLVPAGFNRDLREARDEGVVWHSGQKAHRVLKVVYMDRVTLKSPDGKLYQVEEPRVEYILTPEQAD